MCIRYDDLYWKTVSSNTDLVMFIMRKCVDRNKEIEVKMAKIALKKGKIMYF